MLEKINKDESKLLDSGDVWEIETDKGVKKEDADYVFYLDKD